MKMMKPKLLLFSLCLISIGSCSKSETQTLKEEIVEPVVTFEANGTKYKITSDLDLTNDKDSGAIIYPSITQNGAGAKIKLYTFEVVDKTGNNFILHTSPTQKMEVTTYSITTKSVDEGGGIYSEALFNFGTSQYFGLSKAGQSTITVTSIHEDKADGTFTASLPNYFSNSSVPSLTLSTGVFKNVHIIE
jgi:hypothetical protein